MLLAIHDTQGRDIDRWHHTVYLNLIRIESIEAIGAAKVDTPIAGLQSGTWLELFADKTVMTCESLCLRPTQVLCASIGSRFISDDTPFGREPQGSIVLNDSHDITTGHLKTYMLKAIVLCIIATQTILGTYP